MSETFKQAMQRIADAEAADLEKLRAIWDAKPYEPCVIDYAEAGYREFIMADVPTIARDIGEGVSLLLDMRTRKPIGVRWEYRELALVLTVAQP